MHLDGDETKQHRISLASRHRVLKTWLVVLAGLVLGTAAGPASGQETIVLPHQDWNVICPQDVLCFANYRSRRIRLVVGFAKGSGKLSVNIFVDRRAAPGTPVSVWTDQRQTLELSVTSCGKQFCQAVVAADKSGIVISAFKGAERGMVAYIVGKRIVIEPVSFRGATSAISAIAG
jgi:hypothetical protein